MVLDVYMFRIGNREMIKFLLSSPAELNHHPQNSSQDDEWGCRPRQ